MSETHPANWYPDPTGRHELRYWDGSIWTDHVSNRGITGTDPVAPVLDRIDGALTVGDESRTVSEQISGAGRRGVGLSGPVAGGGGGILTEPVLVVNQKAKIIELNNEYSVFDQHGNRIASVRQIGPVSYTHLRAHET